MASLMSYLHSWGVLLVTENKKGHGCAGVTFLQHKRQRSKLSLIAGLICAQRSVGTERFTAPGWHPQVPLLYCSPPVTLFFRGIWRFQAAPLVSCPLFKLSCTSQFLYGREGREVETAWQMHNRVLSGAPSDLRDWPTRVKWPAEIVCACKASSKRGWWVWSEGVRTKRDKCFMSQLSVPCSYYLSQGCSSCWTLCWHPFDEVNVKARPDCSVVAWTLHSQVSDSPTRRCSVT